MSNSSAAPEIRLVDGHPVATSRTVAEFFGRKHRNIVRKIESLDCSEDYRLLNFEQTVYDRPNPSGGAPIPTKEYLISKDGFVFLAMGLTGKKAAAFKEAYINAFNQMEQQLTSPPVLFEALIPPQRFLTVIDRGQIQQYPLNASQALIDLPKLAARIKQIEVLHHAMGQQLDDLKACYDLGLFLTEEDRG